VAAFRIANDGTLGEASAFVQHTGSSVHPRQRGPHAHQVVLLPDNKFVFVPDLGLDKILVYHFDPGKGTLSAADPPFAALEPGSGPRHLAFHPNGRVAYAVNELKSTVAAFSYNKTRGSFDALQTISTLPKDFSGNSSCAEVAVHQSGRFLYASNRGHDSIAIFEIDRSKGTLRPVEHIPTQGKTPRHFAISPAGDYLFAANQGSDNVVVFRIDRNTGRLSPTGEVLDVSMPVCITFF